jgi:hypothetical protein
VLDRGPAPRLPPGAARTGGISLEAFCGPIARFEAGEHAQVAVKMIDDRGNELLVVRKL